MSWEPGETHSRAHPRAHARTHDCSPGRLFASALSQPLVRQRSPPHARMYAHSLAGLPAHMPAPRYVLPSALSLRYRCRTLKRTLVCHTMVFHTLVCHNLSSNHYHYHISTTMACHLWAASCVIAYHCHSRFGAQRHGIDQSCCQPLAFVDSTCISRMLPHMCIT